MGELGTGRPRGRHLRPALRRRRHGAGAGVPGERHHHSGAALGGEFRVNSYTTGYQWWPGLSSDADGNLVAVWSSRLQDGSGDGVFGQRYDATGAVGGEFPVNAYTTGNQMRPVVAVGPHEQFAVVWVSDGQDGSGAGIYARHFDGSGAALAPEFRLNAYVTGDQNRPVVAADGNGRFVAVWVGTGQDGSGTGIFAQRFVPDLIFRDGFEDGAMRAWSAR